MTKVRDVIFSARPGGAAFLSVRLAATDIGDHPITLSTTISRPPALTSENRNRW